MDANTIKPFALNPKAFQASSGGNAEGVQIPATRRLQATTPIRKRIESRIAESIDHAANRRPNVAYEVNWVSVKSKLQSPATPPCRPSASLHPTRRSSVGGKL